MIARRTMLGAAAALAAVPAASAQPHPDADLVAACAEFHALEATRPVPTGQALICGTPECDQHEDRQDAISELEDGVVARLATMPAVTLDDLRRKAAVLLVWDGGSSLVEDAAYSGDRLAFSLVRDLIG